ncbi:hypothetical protein TTHERM_00137790 (macronuclear) [Tetrahymena thermophila SB210]|uniref:B-box zinc finger protein n=1 Tax=Tetrahymena thermophila (strain SB210) TaxID=312017 RepID=I7LVQ4_TETTS|nr:hypothetical protein TTHERM_00137790 [Tetrahymena thermophila SB210]EAR99516.2 hypothetical protein TTHERM_00137790 [Tetrahymena thermophila SB210]|eukprot:XP_001019761.2 hypothetical protein TTHERM_00137790 [Tetrahymena thermophila SB210]
MSNRSSQRQHLIACNKGGAHSGEYAQYICAKKECQEIDPVLCEVCRNKGHRNHRVIPLRDFFTQITHRVNRQRIKDYSNIQAVVDESERVCRESFNNLKEYISQKIKVFDALLTDCFTTWKENVSLFEEHHCLEVISDISNMQRETDITLFTQQVKKILPHIKFDISEDGVGKPSSTTYQNSNTNIKSITNDILGLPPLSRQEVYGFQQAFLLSLKKISENLNQQLQSVSFGRQKGNTNSILNLTQQQQSRKQEESFISQLEANTTFLDNATPINGSKTRSQYPNSIIPDISPVNNFINVENSSKFFQQPNSSSNQFYQPQQGAAINQSSQLNRSYITPRGTYRASDLVQCVKGQESQSKFYQHKKNTSVAQLSNQKNQLGEYNNLNHSLPDHSATTGLVVLDNVQKQVDDIQKSLDNLRNSFDFQKILQFMDEKSPNRSVSLKPNAEQQQQQNQNNKQGSRNRSNSNQLANFFNSSQQQQQQQVQSLSERSQIVQGNNILNLNNSFQNQGFSQAEQEANLAMRKNLNQIPQQQSIYNQSSVYSQQSMAAKPLTFSEKFQRFREMSKSQSRDNSLNNSYQRYRFDSNHQKQLQEEQESEENRKKSQNNKKVKFQFSQELKHEYVSVSKYIAQGKTDNFSTRLVLLEPTVEIIPHREVTFSFLIKSCKNQEYGQPLAIGVCHRNIVHQNNFEFPQKEESNYGFNDKQKDTISTAASGQASFSSIHGCYLLTSTGFLRNHAYQKQDMKKVPVRFGAKDVIVCHFNPFRKTLKFTKKSSGESCILNVDTIPNDKLYPCVRISYAQDCIEYIHE